MTGPRIVAAGTYELEETGQGGAVLRWYNSLEASSGRGEQEIPAEVWKLLGAVLAGQKIGPQAALRLLTGGRSVRRGLE